LGTGLAGYVLLYYLKLESLVILGHACTPKVWTGVQLLGCSSSGALFVVRKQRKLHQMQSNACMAGLMMRISGPQFLFLTVLLQEGMSTTPRARDGCDRARCPLIPDSLCSIVNIQRLIKVLARQGIAVRYDDGVYELARPSGHREQADSARVLLPASLPLEEKAVSQLLDFAGVVTPGGHAAVCRACATPDFHPGSLAPVGSIVATPADVVIPAAIGRDINCGMRLLRLGLSRARFDELRPRLLPGLKRALLEGARDVPVRSSGFLALFDAGPQAWLETLPAQGLWADADLARLQCELQDCVGLAQLGSAARYAPEALMPAREIVRDAQLGTPGSGNHFVEFQEVDAVLDRHAAWRAGLRAGDVVLMIHSGSRDVGGYVGARWMDEARRAWPGGIAHPAHGLYALEGGLAREYLLAMGAAARYAWANRVVLAEMVRKIMREAAGGEESALLVDVPHNVVLTEDGMNIHRKGSTSAHAGQFALIPGSMGDHSYLALGLGNEAWLRSCSHGAGRSMRRQEMRRHTHAEPARQWECITLRDERRIEEAPSAYKAIGPVIDAQVEKGLIAPVARLRPLLTFKA
jgi:tRNA-splicing ligase RtcB